MALGLEMKNYVPGGSIVVALSVPPTLARSFQYFFAIFQNFDGLFRILMAFSVFLIFLKFLTGVTSNSTRWEVVNNSMSPKRPFFSFFL